MKKNKILIVCLILVGLYSCNHGAVTEPLNADSARALAPVRDSSADSVAIKIDSSAARLPTDTTRDSSMKKPH